MFVREPQVALACVIIVSWWMSCRDKEVLPKIMLPYQDSYSMRRYKPIFREVISLIHNTKTHAIDYKYNEFEIYCLSFLSALWLAWEIWEYCTMDDWCRCVVVFNVNTLGIQLKRIPIGGKAFEKSVLWPLEF